MRETNMAASLWQTISISNWPWLDVVRSHAVPTWTLSTAVLPLSLVSAVTLPSPLYELARVIEKVTYLFAWGSCARRAESSPDWVPLRESGATGKSKTHRWQDGEPAWFTIGHANIPGVPQQQATCGEVRLVFFASCVYPQSGSSPAPTAPASAPCCPPYTPPSRMTASLSSRSSCTLLQRAAALSLRPSRAAPLPLAS